jgi:hypothetical protein
MFFGRSMAWCLDHVAATVTGFISLEMIKCLRTTSGQRALVSMMRIEAVIHVAMETRRAVKPRSGSDKYAVNKKIRSVVSIRSTAIWRVIEIPIWTDGRNPDIHAYSDLGMCGLDKTKRREYDGRQNNWLPEGHGVLSSKLRS